MEPVMLEDFLLASLHHLLAFGLAAMLVSESVLLSRPLDAASLKRLAGVDAGYGATAGLLLAVGLWRVFGGIKGADFYLHNPWFHAKLGAFVLAALLSLWPTLRFLKWRKALKADPSYLPAPAEAAGLRRIVRIELALVAVILVCAAGMARYGGLHW
jgi:putative membrane protein